MSTVDWIALAPQVAKDLLGQPNDKLSSSSHIRYGNKGSWALERETGQFYSHELNEGGGVSWLIRFYGHQVNEFIKSYGYEDLGDHVIFPHDKQEKPKSSSITPAQMQVLWNQAEVKVRYADNFLVLRFPSGHKLSHIKYLPYCKKGKFWINRRPEGKLPIFVSESDNPDKPVLIVEGEKALIGASELYDGDCCCHHGGVSGWKQSDWSAIYKRKVYIYPDNDEAGLKFANELEKHLKLNGCTVKIANPHADAKDKDDLYDAWKTGLFADSATLEKHIVECETRKPKGAFFFSKAEDEILNVKNPDWLVADVVEKQKVMSIFGKPKSGKSFIAISLAAHIASGQNFYGHACKKAPVLYVCGEGKNGVTRRMLALQERFKLIKGSALYTSNRGSRINDTKEYELLNEEVELIHKAEGEVGMIIFDTFQRNFMGNENSAEDVGNFINVIDNLIYDYDCSVCIVHHSGHNNNERARGSSVIAASLDYEFKVDRKMDEEDAEQPKMYVTMEQTLNKEGLGMKTKHFYLDDVPLVGEDFDTSSAVLIECAEEMLPRGKNKQLTGNQYYVDKALQTLAKQKAFDEGDKTMESAGDYWFQPNDLYGKCHGRDELLKDDAVRQTLAAMRKQDKVTYSKHPENDKYYVYQSITFAEQETFTDKFNIETV